MAAPKGNDFYRYRKTDGAPIKYSADYLIAKWDEFLDSCDNQIHYKNELIKSGERAGEIIKVPYQQPLTKSGFCLHAKISEVTFDSYCDENNEKIDKDLFTIATHVQESINNYIDSGCLNGSLVSAYGARLRRLSDIMDINDNHSNINISIGTDVMNLSKR